MIQEPITPIPSAPDQDPRRVDLGDRLFHDVRLSHSSTYSCASCHDTRTNGASATDHDPTPADRSATLNTPTVFNAGLNFRLNWEGNVRTLGAQFQQTLRNPDTMATNPEEILGRLRADADTVKQFREVYGRAPEFADVSDAIVAYERSLLTPGSRFDRWLAGDADAITQEELTGYQLFKSLGCVSCHQGVNVGGNLYQRHGIFHPLAGSLPEILRVPSLRNVATTAPYFHDGSAPTLSDAIKAMAYAQLDRVLTERQTAAIEAFLQALTGLYLGRPVTPAVPMPEAARSQ